MEGSLPQDGAPACLRALQLVVTDRDAPKASEQLGSNSRAQRGYLLATSGLLDP
ncbi:hypothetical protein ACFUNF_17355 [Streptomyces sp. NPDC057291]|uniref:hypothetical protein n=1 Tax=Streptomyces sp. NPDC057291 TaxID=3346087 RepID=UPI00362D11DF